MDDNSDAGAGADSELVNTAKDRDTEIDKTKEELEILQVQAIFSLIETIHFRNSTKKLMFLTNNQARMVDFTGLEKFLLAFEIPTKGPRKPKLVINLFGSQSYLPLNGHDVGGTMASEQPCIGELSPEGVELSEERIALFLKKHIFPIAIETNAIIIMDNVECTMSRIMSFLCESEAATRQGKLPFTVFQFAAACLYWTSSEQEGSLANTFKRQSKRWAEQDSRIRDVWFPGAGSQATKERVDIDNIALLGGATHYVFCDGKGVSVGLILCWLCF